MNQNQNRPKFFRLKPFISFLTVLSFVLLAFSGFILYVRPEGSLARWVGWKMLGLDKSGWEGSHIIFCALFVMAGIIHLVLNFKAIILYLTGGIDNGRRNLLELVAAVVLIMAVLLSAVMRVPPASTLIKGRSSFKNSPASLRVDMPSPDFEKQSLRKVAEYLGVAPEMVLKLLESRGLKVSNIDSSLESVARKNRLSPQDLFLLINPHF
jgi:hypothetical protein